MGLSKDFGKHRFIPRRLLVYHIGSLGDTLVSVPALWAVSENFPEAQITMLTNEPQVKGLVQANTILDGSGMVDDCLFYPVGKPWEIVRLLFQLRSRKFDALVYLIRAYEDDPRVKRDKIFFWLAGVPVQLGMKQLPSDVRQASLRPLPVVERMADSLLNRLRADGLKIPSGSVRTDVNLGEQEELDVQYWLSGLPGDGGRRWVGLGIGGKVPCNIWPFERYLAVMKRLVSDFDIWPVFFGGPADRIVGDRLIRELGRGYVAAEVLGVRSSMAAMKRCALFLGNDTGSMHMAAAGGVLCVIPFSSQNVPGLWYPYGSGHVILRTPVSCEGCGLERCVEKKMSCILSITEDDVFGACSSILTGNVRK